MTGFCDRIVRARSTSTLYLQSPSLLFLKTQVAFVRAAAFLLFAALGTLQAFYHIVDYARCCLVVRRILIYRFTVTRRSGFACADFNIHATEQATTKVAEVGLSAKTSNVVDNFRPLVALGVSIVMLDRPIG